MNWTEIALPWNYLQHPEPQFCEANFCGWIAQPANAWSTLAYCFVGLWLNGNRSNKNARFLRLLGAIAVLIGVASFTYHAFYTFMTQFFDLLSMFLLSNFILVFNLSRAGIITKNTQTLVWLGSVLISALALIFLLPLGRIMFGSSLVLSLILECYLSLKYKHCEYRDFLNALSFFLIAFIIWGLDLYKIVCDPNNHVVQGHAVWHLLTAVCLIFIDRFYRQFDELA